MNINKNAKVYIEKAKEMFLFANVDQTLVLKTLEDRGSTIESFSEGATIFSPEDFRKMLCMVLSGSVKVYSEDSNSLINIIPAGGVFGVASMFGAAERYCSSVVAGSHCEILFLSEELLTTLITKDKTIMMNYINFLSNKVRFLNRKIATYTADSAKSKLLKYLMMLANQHSNEEGVVTLPTSCQQLAETLNMGRASLYRAFEELENDGIAVKNGKTVKINH